MNSRSTASLTFAQARDATENWFGLFWDSHTWFVTAAGIVVMCAGLSADFTAATYKGVGWIAFTHLPRLTGVDFATVRGARVSVAKTGLTRCVPIRSADETISALIDSQIAFITGLERRDAGIDFNADVRTRCI